MTQEVALSAESKQDATRRYAREWYHRNKQRLLMERKAKRDANPGAARQYHAAWRNKNRERVREIARGVNRRRYAKIREYLNSGAQAEKQKARFALNAAVKAGTIVKPATCGDCGAVTPTRRLHGHHEDYAKPYDVAWLCALCHGKRHTQH